MQKRVENIYCLGLFTLYNLILLDNDIVQFEMKTLILLSMTLIAILIKSISRGYVVESWKRWDKADWIMYVIGLVSLAVTIFRLFSDNGDYELFTVSLGIAGIYILMRQVMGLEKQLFQAYSMTNVLIAIVYITSILWFSEMTEWISLLQGKNVVGWALLALVISALGYCKSDKWKVCYGIGMILESFILFINKNMVAIIIFAVVVLFLPIVFKPTKKLVRNAMQIFFTYIFAWANMSLLTGYTTLLEGMVVYDLEISVYIELGLAIFGVAFFHYWDKETTGECEDDKCLPEVQNFIRKVICLISFMLISGMVMTISGGAPEEYIKLNEMLAQCRNSFINQKSLVMFAFELAGGIGASGVMLIYALILYRLVTDRRKVLIAEQKEIRLLTAVFLVQSVVVTQSMIVLPMYVVFVCVYMNQIRDKR